MVDIPSKDASGESDKDPLFNYSFQKGYAVLSAFQGARREMTLNELCQVLSINRSSAQRMIYTLEKMGLVGKSPQTRKYRLTIRTLELGYNYLASDALIEAANPFLLDLANRTGETANLTEPDGTEMVYVSRFVAPNHIPVQMPIGSRIPMYCTASGRAYLSNLPDERRDALLGGSRIAKHTQWTELRLPEIRALLEKARHNGYAYNKEEYFLGDMTIGAAILGASGQPVAAVHVVAPTSRWTLEAACERLAPAVIECARGISQAVRATT